MVDSTATRGAQTRALLAEPWDVLVVGGGNAAVTSALTARELGARVLLVERAPKALRGGNSRHTRNIRVSHTYSDAYSTGKYEADELWADLCSVGDGPSDEQLALQTVRASEALPAWMSQRGILWQPPLSGTLHLGRTNRFFLGGGKALLNAYYRTAERMGVTTMYDASVEHLHIDGDRCRSAVVEVDGTVHRVNARSIVCASGGFEANIRWLQRYWGDAALNYHVRGPRYNDGTILRLLLDASAQPVGEERGFHAVAVDARSPKFDGGIATRLDCIPFGIVVNSKAERFYDEGEDIWPKRYAIWGRNIAMQEGQIAYSLWDSKVDGLFLRPMYGAIQGPTIGAVAQQLGLDGATFHATIDRYNSAASFRVKQFDPSKLDGLTTVGLEPPKSNWAQPIDEPPFSAVPMRPGITFTYMGVQIGSDARVKLTDGTALRNVYAAGEIMSGNILSTGYMAGFGMTIGTVWGRIAGKEAAGHAAQ